MKKQLLFTLVLVLAFSAIIKAQNVADWKEKNDFHKIMAQTFHPAEDGNFQPIRDRIDEMVTKAEAWQKSPVPLEIRDVKKMKKNLGKLVKLTKKLQNNIKAGAPDQAVLKQLTALHDVFHTIVGICHPEDE